MPRVRTMSPEERRAMIGSEDVLWTREMVAAYLGCSVRTVDGLPIPRADIAGPRYVPDVVREWARLRLSHQLPAA